MEKRLELGKMERWETWQAGETDAKESWELVVNVLGERDANSSRPLTQ